MYLIFEVFIAVKNIRVQYSDYTFFQLHYTYESYKLYHYVIFQTYRIFTLHNTFPKVKAIFHRVHFTDKPSCWNVCSLVCYPYIGKFSIIQCKFSSSFLENSNIIINEGIYVILQQVKLIQKLFSTYVFFQKILRHDYYFGKLNVNVYSENIICV